MIKLENTEWAGFRSALRGMRNPMNSWDRADSEFTILSDVPPVIGENDSDLMHRLGNAGTEHRKYLRMMIAWVDITAPLYWWKEFDTYKVGTVANSCSTMHKIHAKEFTLDDFSHDHLIHCGEGPLHYVIDSLNYWRDMYLNGGLDDNADGTYTVFEPKDKTVWEQMIQLLPSSYNQKRTVMVSYEALANMYRQRKNHKLKEWHVFCDWIKTLPCSEYITGEAKE